MWQHNQEVQAEWHKLQMQGSDLEKIERKHAELEFSVRDKETLIIQQFAQIVNKLPGGSLDLLELKPQLEQLQLMLKADEQLSLKLAVVEKRVDNYYRMNAGECQEGGFC